jgi:hypothetical protein
LILVPQALSQIPQVSDRAALSFLTWSACRVPRFALTSRPTPQAPRALIPALRALSQIPQALRQAASLCQIPQVLRQASLSFPA